MVYVVGVSSGLYRVAAPPELASVVRKIGFALTRGTNAIEISGDVPHEIDFTMGRELRYIAEKQGLELALHGSLTVPMTEGDIEHWREADDHMRKSVLSAVFGGCKYVNFHACLYFWPELFTYAEARLIVTMVDELGEHVYKKLKEVEGLRKWFSKVSKLAIVYDDAILGPAKIQGILTAVREEVEKEVAEKKLTPEKAGELFTKLLDERTRDAVEKHLEAGERWVTEEVGNLNDSYRIVAHFLYYKQDPIWKEMVKMHEDIIKKLEARLKPEVKSRALQPIIEDLERKVDWLDTIWEIAKAVGGDDQRKFKEFYYGVVGAKYLFGHLKKIVTFIADELPIRIEDELKTLEIPDLEKEKRKFDEIIKDLKIVIETPDARSPEYAGLYTLWHPKQIYVAIKSIREELSKNPNPKVAEWSKKIFMLLDFEHISTQGADPLREILELTKIVPNIGEYILSLHVTKPTPLHHHMEVEIGDVEVYKLLWTLRKAGLGKYFLTYLIFERGGEADPFKRSVTALKIMAEHLEKDIPPEKLSGEFFGIATGEIASEERQLAIIREHAREPLKGLLVVPEEEYTFLSRAALEKPGVTSEKWKKEELK